MNASAPPRPLRRTARTRAPRRHGAIAALAGRAPRPRLLPYDPTPNRSTRGLGPAPPTGSGRTSSAARPLAPALRGAAVARRRDRHVASGPADRPGRRVDRGVPRGWPTGLHVRVHGLSPSPASARQSGSAAVRGPALATSSSRCRSSAGSLRAVIRAQVRKVKAWSRRAGAAVESRRPGAPTLILPNALLPLPVERPSHRAAIVPRRGGRSSGWAGGARRILGIDDRRRAPILFASPPVHGPGGDLLTVLAFNFAGRPARRARRETIPFLREKTRVVPRGNSKSSSRTCRVIGAASFAPRT